MDVRNPLNVKKAPTEEEIVAYLKEHNPKHLWMLENDKEITTVFIRFDGTPITYSTPDIEACRDDHERGTELFVTLLAVEDALKSRSIYLDRFDEGRYDMEHGASMMDLRELSGLINGEDRQGSKLTR